MTKSAQLFLYRLARALEPHGAIAEFCRNTGFGRSSVQNWLERGQTPTIENLDRVAEGLGTTAWELLKPEEPAMPAPKPEPTNADLLEEIRALRASEPSDPWIRDVVILLGDLDKTKRPEALAWLRRFVSSSKKSKPVKKEQESR